MTEPEARKYQFWNAVLKEIAKEYHTNTNIDTIIRNIDARLKEFNK